MRVCGSELQSSNTICCIPLEPGDVSKGLLAKPLPSTHPQVQASGRQPAPTTLHTRQGGATQK